MDESLKETFGDKWRRWGVNKLILGVMIGAIVVPFTPLAVWSGQAANTTKNAVSVAVLDALKPICIARAERDPEYDVRVAELQAAPSYNRTTTVIDYGWASLPGMGDTVDRRLAQACAEGVLAAIEVEPA